MVVVRVLQDAQLVKRALVDIRSFVGSFHRFELGDARPRFVDTQLTSVTSCFAAVLSLSLAVAFWMASPLNNGSKMSVPL